jgi:hypothetical protein
VQNERKLEQNFYTSYEYKRTEKLGGGSYCREACAAYPTRASKCLAREPRTPITPLVASCVALRIVAVAPKFLDLLLVLLRCRRQGMRGWIYTSVGSVYYYYGIRKRRRKASFSDTMQVFFTLGPRKARTTQ